MLTSDFRIFSDKFKKIYFFNTVSGLCCVADIIDLCFAFGLLDLREFNFVLMIINILFIHADTHIERNFDTT